MENFVFFNPCKIIFGRGTITQLGKETAQYGKKVLLVTGGGSIKRSGLYDQVVGELKNHGITFFEVSGVQPNPRLSSVQEGTAICKREGIEFILAVGGGSVIDAAKAMALGVKYNGDVWDFFEKKAEVKEALPVGSVLTLAATGSEMNKNSVITKWETNQKRNIGGACLIPKFAIMDPTLTFSVPRDQTVNGIVDIMAHVFEQYFSLTPDTALQDRFSEGILQTMIETAPVVLDHPDDYEARASMMWCSTWALNSLIVMGKASDFASHMIEHEISAIYDIPHGAGLSILFPNWMKYVLDAGTGKFVQYATRVWSVKAEGKSDQEVALEGIEKTREFFTKIGAPATLGHYKIGPENIPVMAAKAVKYGMLGGYKKLNQQDVENILKMCL
jgi:alcohol dehydrogenase